MSQQVRKLCPRCQEPAATNAVACPACGHRYRTQFPADDRTRLDLAGEVAYSPAAPAHGPLDNTERAVSMVWTVIGLAFVFFVTAFFWGALAQSVMDREGREAGQISGMMLAFNFTWALVTSCILSFLVMRYRRLYLSAPGGAPHPQIAQRRAVFSVVASLGVFGLFALAYFQMQQLDADKRKEREPQVLAAPPMPTPTQPDPYTERFIPPPQMPRYAPARPRMGGGGSDEWQQLPPQTPREDEQRRRTFRNL